MRVLVVSDTHRKDNNFYKLIKTIGPLDLVVHCGDAEGTEELLSEDCECPFEGVIGNCDIFSSLPQDRILELNGHRIFITHGHRYNVSVGMAWLYDAAIDNNCDVVCFGHTHVPFCKTEHGILAVNPGSISLPRQGDRTPTYAIMEIPEKGEIVCNIYRFNEEEY